MATSPTAPPPSGRARETRRAALLSVASNTTLTTLKLIVGFATSSISVISEGVHSGNDLVAALLAYFSVQRANRPADERHRYGHGKFEALSGGIEAGLIVVAALAIMVSAVRCLLSGKFEGVEHGPALAVMGISAVVNVIVSRHLYKVARRHDSMALGADAAHLTADVWTSLGVFVGLGAMYVVERLGNEAHWIDPALALMVGALVITQGWRIAREAVDQLLDRALPDEELAHVASVIGDHAGRFVEFHRLRSRRAGHERHIDLHLVVCEQMTVGQAHGLTDHLEEEIAGIFPNAQVMIHVEPCADAECKARRADGTWAFCEQQRRRNASQIAETPQSPASAA